MEESSAPQVTAESMNMVTGKQPRASDDRVTVRPGLSFPRTVSAVDVKIARLPGYSFDLELVWWDAERTYSVRSLMIKKSEQRGIVATDLRQLPLQDVRAAVLRLAMPGDLSREHGLEEKDYYLNLVTGRLTDDLLKEVGKRAAIAQALQGNPNQMITYIFDVPKRTASHWIARAREAGYLD